MYGKQVKRNVDQENISIYYVKHGGSGPSRRPYLSYLERKCQNIVINVER